MFKCNRWEGGTDEEYSTQHFGFGAQRLKIALRQMIEEKMRSGVSEMESYLLNSLDLNDSDKAAIRLSCKKLLQLYAKRAGPSFENLDMEIDRMLTVPPHVLLPSDEVHEVESSDAEFEKLKEEVAALRTRVERAALMEALLTSEDKEISSMEKVLETAKQHMELQDMISKSLEKNDLNTLQSGAQLLCAQRSVSDDDLFDVSDVKSP